jgi:hypothetical protein
MLGLVGCGDEEEPVPVAPAPPAATPPPKAPVKTTKPDKVEPVEEVLEPNLKLVLDEPLESTTIFASLSAGVLQIRNHEAEQIEVLPSVFLWANVGEDDFKALENKSVDAKMFAHTSSETSPWHAAGSGTVKLLITKVTDTMLVGEVTAGELINVDTGQKLKVDCKFVAELK